MRDLSWAVVTAVFFISVSSCTALAFKYENEAKIKQLELQRARIECRSHQKEEN